MILKELKPRQALNKAFLKLKPNRTEIDGFKANLFTLLERINDSESEEFHKNLVSDFLKDTYYKQNHFINTKGRNDLVIHNGQNANSTVGVIIEAKKPTNKTEMITRENINKKAFQELVLYYLRERITHNNLEIKHLAATNIYEWFIFDVTTFDRLFAQNKNFVKQFQDFEAGRLADTKTEFFYKKVAEPFIDGVSSEIEFTYFNINDYYNPHNPSLKPLANDDSTSHNPRFQSWANDDDNELIPLFKLFSPEHLLKLPFANDSNTLDKGFYNELLHIIGLTETKDGGKKLIERNKPGERHTGTILEDAIIQLDSLDKLSRLEKPDQFGSNKEERLFNVALELSITWINRILFLKLLEAQLITYHKADKSYSFLNLDKIKNYDDLNSLFFQVLARKYDERNEDVKKAFEKVPYLNSSLFEPTELEHATIFISNLNDNKTIPIFSQTVLKDQQGKKRTGNISTLQYLFEFLDAYDFGAEGGEEIQEDNKTLINASVLGLIFEKINGYKDGSFFTPGFITMYMCRETIRKAVVQKFKEAAAPLLRGAGGVSKRKIIPYNPKLKELARELRNNSTKSEIILWKELKGKFEGKYDFHRQKPLDNYIADFFCHELKLVIEIDGESHNWEETQRKDFEKEYRLNELGLNVLRFPDTDIFKHLENVLETIRMYIEGFEKRDLSAFRNEDTPLNPLSRGDFALPDTTEDTISQQFFTTLDDIYDQIGEDRLFTRQQANDIVNSLKICDPAVGSGHFLVSALNEIIAVKNDLKILTDKDGKSLHRYEIEVQNDELIVTDENGEIFEYNPGSKESQRVQETLFHEKQTIIENCLFGVDINPNSVKICRLRLWIELLKHAYYKTESRDSIAHDLNRGLWELETLPNIDINIKCGNSLVSRFAIDADMKQALKKSKWNIDTYKTAVATYRNAQNKEQKRETERLITEIKADFRSEIAKNDPKLLRKHRLEGELFNLMNQTSVFGETEKEKKEKAQKAEQLTREIQKLEAEIEEIKSNKIYENAFEWRFEFPEVLNDEGDFVGFDVVIGNPPYVDFREIEKNQTDFLRYYKTLENSPRPNLYQFFIELGYNIMCKNAYLCYINPSQFLSIDAGYGLRKFIVENTIIQFIDDLSYIKIFDEAATYTVVWSFQKQKNGNYPVRISKCYTVNDIGKETLQVRKNDIVSNGKYLIIANVNQLLINKIEKEKVKLGSICNMIWGTSQSGYGQKKILHGTYEQLSDNEKQAYKKIIQTRDIKNYIIDWKQEYIPAEIFSDKAVEKFLLKEKIVIARMTLKLQAAIDNEQFFVGKSTVLFDWVKELNPLYLLAILNSKLINFWYVNYFENTHLSGGYIRFDIPYLKKIPVCITDESKQQAIALLVEQLINAKSKNPSADTTDLETQIDRIVYELYGLTTEEIKIVEGK